MACRQDAEEVLKGKEQAMAIDSYTLGPGLGEGNVDR